jgi:2-dehydropantoate 2-reductase
MSLRVAVFGVGGVGAYFGARLAEVGNDVSFVARGAHLAAIRANGLRVDSVLGDMLVKPKVATDSAADVGPVDAVLLGVKTWQVADVAPALKPLLGRDTFVVPLQNGVETADLLAESLGTAHVNGGVCGGFCFIVGPGHVKHIGGITFIKFGELDGHKSERVERLRAEFAAAKVDVAVPDDIRVALWEKLMLVVPFGGVGAVSRAPIGVIMKTPETRALIEAGMREIAAVALARGVPLAPDTVERTLTLLDGTTPTGTSSLQRDIAAGKRSELDAWTGAVVRLGARLRVPTPTHSFLYATLLPLERRARGELAF